MWWWWVVVVVAVVVKEEEGHGDADDHSAGTAQTYSKAVSWEKKHVGDLTWVQVSGRRPDEHSNPNEKRRGAGGQPCSSVGFLEVTW